MITVPDLAKTEDTSISAFVIPVFLLRVEVLCR